MINITLPDGTVKQFEKGTTALQVASSISEGLARNVISAKVNDEVWDATRPIYDDANVTLLTWRDKDGKQTVWHSSAHLMAEALEFYYPGIKLAIGPPIENGFYYDVDFGDYQFTDKDFKKIEDKIIELARTKTPYVRKEISKAEALAYFEEKNDEYKT
jgi:threonyl-tRNA synthetase